MATQCARKLLALLLLASCAALLAGCGGDADKPEAQETPAGKTPSPAGKQPAFSLTTRQFAEEFEADAAAAAKKYAGKWVELEGPVAIVAMKNIVGQDVMTLKGIDEETATGLRVRPVVCGLAPEAVKAASQLTVTQQVKLLGLYEEGSAGATLAHCRIAWTGPDPAVKVAAEKLAADYAADEKAADATYNEKQVLVEGVVAEVTKDEFGSPSLLLAGAKKDDQTIPVSCVFTKDAAKQAEKVAKGQRVRVKGQCRGLLGEEVALSACVLMD